MGPQQGRLDKVAREGRELTAEERQAWDQADARIVYLDSEIRTQLDAERRAKEAGVAREAWAGVPAPVDKDPLTHVDDDELTRRFLFAPGKQYMDFNLAPIAAEKRAIRLGLEGAELRDYIHQNEQRALEEVTSGAGGALVPLSFARRLYDFLEWYTGVRQLNTTILTTPSGEPLNVPSVTAHGTATLTGEGTALAEHDPAFTVTTFHAWKYGELTQISRELIDDSGVDILPLIMQDLSRAIGRVTDTDYVSGSGSNKPTGLLTTAGTGATAQTGSTGIPNYSNLVDLVYSVNPLYRQHGAQWFMLDKTAASLRKLTDSQNRPLWEPSMQIGEPDRLIGYPVVLDPNMPACSTAASTALPIIFGDFRSFYIRDVGMLRFERSDEFAFSTDIVTFRALLRTDSHMIDSLATRMMADPTT